MFTSLLWSMLFDYVNDYLVGLYVLFVGVHFYEILSLAENPGPFVEHIHAAVWLSHNTTYGFSDPVSIPVIMLTLHAMAIVTSSGSACAVSAQSACSCLGWRLSDTSSCSSGSYLLT